MNDVVKVTKTRPKRVSTDPARVRVTLKAVHDNTSPVYVGDSAVTNETGFPLAPGDELTVTAHLDRLFCIADDTGCRLAFITFDK